MSNRTLFTALTIALAAGPMLAQQPRRMARDVMETISAQRQQLGLDTRHEFRVFKHTEDNLDMVHTRMHQFYRGLRVYGGEVIAHLKGSEQLAPTDSLYRGINLNPEPSLSAQEALAIVDRELELQARELGLQSGHTRAPEVELLVYPVTRQKRKAAFRHLPEEKLNALHMEAEVEYHLAYLIQTFAMNEHRPKQMVYTVDAYSGRILNKWNALKHSASKGTGKGQYSGTVTIDTNQLSSTSYELRDLTRATTSTGIFIRGGSNTGAVLTDADNSWGDGTDYNGTNSSTPAGQTAGVDAMWGAAMLWDMYKNVLGRNGIDGAGKGFFAVVHATDSSDNAYWDDSCFCLHLGNVTSATGNNYSDYETMGHEGTHGLCSAEANHEYVDGEKGGLNEGNSDIFGAAVTYYAINNKGTGASIITSDPVAPHDPWIVGELTDNPPLRWMNKPSKDGQSPDAWSTAVASLDNHYSSGPVNRFFFFLSQGGKQGTSSTALNYSNYFTKGDMTGIGIDKAIKIWYRAEANYMTSSTMWAGARTACMNACKDLYGDSGPEYIAVQRAWAGVNVGADVAEGPSALAITSQPSNQTVSLGSAATFTVGAGGGTAPYHYQWQKNGVAISGATSASYTFTPVMADSGAKFKAVVTDSAATPATVTSSEATLTVGTVSPSLILNGDFEAGSSNWSGTTAVIKASSNAHAGSMCAVMGGKGTTTTQDLYQTVSIPAGAAKATLTFYLRVESAEGTSTAYDKFTTTVRTTANALIKTLGTTSNISKGKGYLTRTYDLSAYKGQTVRIRFRATEDSDLQTTFYLDDVKLAVE